MHDFHYVKGKMYCEKVPVEDVEKAMGTPFYLYSYNTLRNHFTVFDAAFSEMPHIVCFAAKANSNIAILKIFVNEGGGMDIVSGGNCIGHCRRALIRKRLFIPVSVSVLTKLLTPLIRISLCLIWNLLRNFR